MFAKRLISGIVLVVLALFFILTGGYVLAAVSLFLSLVAYRELMKACGLSGENKTIHADVKGSSVFLSAKSVSLLEAFGYAGIIAYYAVMVFVSDRVYLLLTANFILMAFMALYVFTFPKYNAKDILMAFALVSYAPLMLTFIFLTRQLDHGKYYVWMIFISSWICDTCAYCVGMLIGKHKLAPVLSPKKSVEGAIGGVTGSALVGGLYAYFLSTRTWFVSPDGMSVGELIGLFALISAIGAVISQVGDLAASAIKRNMDIKDYGRLIPGHGGVMDRFDSVIFTAPGVYFLALLLLHR